MKKRTLMMIAVLVVSFSATAFANHGHSKRHSLEDKFFGKYHFFIKNKDTLGLSEAQLETAKDVKFRVKRLVAEQRAQMEVAMLDIWRELYREDSDRAQIEGALDAKMAAKSAKMSAYIDGILDLKDLLDEQQMTTAKDLWWKEKYQDSGSI